MEVASIYITLFNIKGPEITCYSIYNTKNLTGTKQKSEPESDMIQNKVIFPFVQTKNYMLQHI
ncbi:hypothetical protein bcere0011_29290 [Bacillus cereus m1550]|nr:hypothetical protein bcere0011_29290 [Bacillus cereus m1550]